MPVHEGVKSSGSLAVGTTAVTTGPALVYGYILSGGTAASTISINDGAGGTAKWVDSIKAQSAAGDATVSVAFPFAIVCGTTLSVVVAGTAATAFVLYIPI
jgi:hypothetical protein